MASIMLDPWRLIFLYICILYKSDFDCHTYRLIGFHFSSVLKEYLLRAKYCTKYISIAKLEQTLCNKRKVRVCTGTFQREIISNWRSQRCRCDAVLMASSHDRDCMCTRVRSDTTANQILSFIMKQKRDWLRASSYLITVYSMHKKISVVSNFIYTCREETSTRGDVYFIYHT